MPYHSKKRTLTKQIFSILLILIVALYALPSLLINTVNIQIKEDVYAGEYGVQTGYYIGNGRRLSITGLGFQPEFVMIKSDSSNTAAVFKTSAMPTKNMAYFSATVDNRDLRLTLDADGFTVSESDQFKLDNDGFTLRNSANINIPNVRYTWIAFTGSNCTSSSSNFCVGTYTGTTATTQDIDIGFKPDFVMVKRDTAVGAHYKTTALGENTETLWFTSTAKATTGYIHSLNSNGFTVGTTDNANGGNYYYIAFKEATNLFKQGSYDGNGIDNTAISGIGFKPDMIIVKNGTNSTAANTAPFMNQTFSYGNSSSYIGVTTANLVNIIKTLDSDGFTVGTDVKINASSNTYYYIAFGGATKSSSGTFKMAQGYYEGNGTIQSIENIGFKPDLVIVKNSSNQIAVFRTRLMGLDSTAYFTGATANFYGGIISINDDSFDVGAHFTVNKANDTYHWQAFGNAYDPIDNSGASDFAIGAIYGNGLDDRNITNLPFQPDLVVVKSISTGTANMRTSQHTGDISSYFQASTDTVNLIQEINSDGFQIGNNASVNTSAVLYFWFAFKSGDNFKVGSYTGNTPSTQTIEIDPTAFQSNLIWTVPSNAVGGILKPSTLTDPASQYFLATANASTQITEITSKGFSVGSGTGANGVTTIRYMAWKAPYTPPPTNLPDTPGSPTFTSTSTTNTVVTWSAASGADYYIVERATDRSGSPGLYRPVGTTSALSMGDSTLNANQKYWYRVKSSNPNGYSSYSTPTSITTQSQPLKIQTGYYIGTGDQFSITGIGFAPELVLIKSDTTNIPMIFKTSTMRDDVLGFFSASADGSVANLNLENVRYTWIAFSGSDCSSTGYFCLGTYTGNGVAQSLETGFQPDFVTVKNNDATAAHYKTSSLGSNNHTIFYINVVKNQTGAYISSLNTDGFSVGTTDSIAGGTFHYFAFKEKTDFFKQGTYDGNSTDNTGITGVGFKPDWVVVKNGTNTSANNTYAFSNLTQSYGNSSSYFSATANLVNMIKGIDSDGFTVGTDVKVNSSADTYYYFAFGGVPAPTTSGTFRMAEGTYTGNGGIQTISNIGFAPDLVMVKDDAAQYAVFRTRLMSGNSTAYFSYRAANIVDAITQLTEDGFVVSGDLRTNRDGDIYHWQAFGNAYDPIDNSGASDFAIGAIYGNSLDDRDIKDIPFTPDLVVVKSITSAGNAVLRTSLHPTDYSSHFLATADATNMIQDFSTNSFQLGSNAYVNSNAVVNFWFAFKAGENFKVGEYPGTGIAKSITIGTGYESDLIWTKTNSAVGPILKPSTLADPASQYFLATANATTQITAITGDGFSVGTSTGANANGATVRYMAWRIPVYLISITVADGEVSYGVLESFASKTTLPTDMPPTGDTQRVTNNSSSAVNINIKGQNSVGECIWSLSGTNGYNQYKHQFCNDTDNDCTAPPTNYSDLSVAYQRLFSNLAKDAYGEFQLRLVMPTSTSCNSSQQVDVTVQATEI